jgi:hypothetical protein
MSETSQEIYNQHLKNKLQNCLRESITLLNSSASVAPLKFAMKQPLRKKVSD